MQNTGGDQAGLFTLISAVAAVVSAIVAGLAWMRATEANAIARRALEAQTATRVNVRCRRGEVWRPFPQFPLMVVLVVGETVGGLPITIASAKVVFRGRGYEHSFNLIQTDTGEPYSFPELPQVLAPRNILRVPMNEQRFHQAIAEHLQKFQAAPEREFVLRLEDDTGVHFDSSPIHVNRFHEDCPTFVQGASDPPSPTAERGVRRALRAES